MRIMKKRILLFSVVMGALVCFAGCKEEGKVAETGGEAKTKATMFVTEDRQIQITYNESFDKEHYKEEELKTAIAQELQEFNTDISKEQAAKLENLTVADGSATLRLSFVDYEAYTKYANTYVDAEGDVKVFVGTESEAAGAGQRLPDTMKNKDGAAVEKAALELTDACLIVYTNEAQKLYIDGNCKYYSESVEMKDGLLITEAGKDNYIIYQNK